MNNSFLKRSYRHYYTQCMSGEWEEVERLACVTYDPATAFAGKYPQRWYCDFEADYIVRLRRDKAGEQLYNAVRYMRRKEKLVYAEQLGCVGENCPTCKGWTKITDGEIKCDGFSAQRIADTLNEQQVLSPLEYKKDRGLPHPTGSFSDKEDSKWSAHTIIRMLADETYAGTLIQGKQSTPNYKLKDIIDLPETEWRRTENAHEAIIRRADFHSVFLIAPLCPCTACVSTIPV
ncbi:hypothetical protein FACS1894219_08430 [Clostridia bacterium]|nr:hypothetical protein FACS1894219_08430 [Clostridia bacterium]